MTKGDSKMNKKKVFKLLMNVSLLLGVALCSSQFSSLLEKAHAEDSTKTKLQNDADDAAKDSRKTVRKAKKKVRDNTGHGSVKKDMQDSAADVQDDVSTETKKLKRKAQ
jgi:hypothetical protein